jgi:EAL domain-containing protein (putative c-di-GMP-specific phosphodiesterase class I)
MELATLPRDDLTPDGRPSYSRKVIRESLALLRSHLDMEVAFVGRFGGGRRWFEYVDADQAFAPIEPGGSDPIEESYCSLVVGGRIPELIRDTAEFAVLRELDATTSLPVGSHLSVALAGDDGPVGTLCCFSRRPDTSLQQRDLDVLRMFADLIGSHLQFLLAHDQRTGSVRARIDDVLLRGGPEIALQPIRNIVTGRTRGFEALSRFPSIAASSSDWTVDRWFHEADLVGLGPQLEESALRAALALVGCLGPDQLLSVNVSARALLQAPEIGKLFAGAHASRLVLELTEHAEVEDYGHLAHTLEPVRRAGTLLAVDDAGSGYAGLEHILRLRPDVLKLDRCLVQDIAHDAGRRALCQAMAGFTAETGAALVAEGVETPEDLATLRDLGVVYAQGYLLGRPEIRRP